MDKQPLNTGEQKDMVEFFTDLISKLEEMGPELVRTYSERFIHLKNLNQLKFYTWIKLCYQPTTVNIYCCLQDSFVTYTCVFF